jgi:hypothetical protein
MEFTTRTPSHVTGLRVSIDYVHPDDPDAKPHAVQEVVEVLARGARFDTSVPKRCTASDAQLVASGEAACPAASKVGEGAITIDTGFPEPNRFIEADIAFLNNRDQLIFLSTERETGARVVSRSSVSRRKLTSTAPPLPGTPPDGGAIDTVEANIEPIKKHGRPYIRTPSECPDSGRWINKIHFTYRDGVSQTVKTANPCD